ncbi:MAG: hypothetical protein IJ827_02300 [Lachnospiraceae bacterium]|nr:hypothetical protein [Lachnospiraceae bacterium]
MRSLVSSLNMYLLDYLIVPIWTVFSVLGNKRSAYIMLPVTVIFLALNYLNTKKTTKLLLLDMNLSAACLAGIVLNTFLYIRFIYADAQIVTNMVSIIFFYVLFNLFACILCLSVKALYHRHNLKIISRMAADDREPDTFEYEEDEEYEEEEDDEDDEEDEEDEDEEDEYDAGAGRSFISSIGNFLSGRADDEDESYDDGEEAEEQDGADDYVKPDGPKFRVVKK